MTLCLKRAIDAGRTGLSVGLAITGFAIAVINPSAAWACATNTLMGDPVERVFELKIESGRVAQGARTIRVMEGDTVHLHWTTDAPILLHLRGYDIEKKVGPDAVTEITFEAHTTGRFAIDTIGKGEPSGEVPEHTPLGYLEVYPR